MHELFTLISVEILLKRMENKFLSKFIVDEKCSLSLSAVKHLHLLLQTHWVERFLLIRFTFKACLNMKQRSMETSLQGLNDTTFSLWKEVLIKNPTQFEIFGSYTSNQSMTCLVSRHSTNLQPFSHVVYAVKKQHWKIFTPGIFYEDISTTFLHKLFRKNVFTLIYLTSRTFSWEISNFYGTCANVGPVGSLATERNWKINKMTKCDGGWKVEITGEENTNFLISFN